MITDKAKKLVDMNTETTTHFSDGWLRNFMAKHWIHVLDVCGEKRSADYVAAKTNSEVFAKLVMTIT